MNVRIATMLAALVPVAGLGVLGARLDVPYVALGPGPTFNTLGEVEVEGKQRPVVDVQGVDNDPTTGNLNMTTVSVRDGLTIFEALSLWLDGSSGIVPRSEVYPPGQSKEDIEQGNEAEFKQSENEAELAAARYLDYPIGLTISNVADEGPSAGLLRAGDWIVEVDGKPVDSAHAVQEIVAGSKPGVTLPMKIRRDDEESVVEVKLGERPDDGDRGFLGIGMSEDAEVPFTVEFNLADIGGPSAGLMFTLAMIDKLTPGPLNDGKFIAGTGTIDSVGEVGPIGGIRYKMQAARDAGAEYFLVPADNCLEAKSTAPEGLTLIKVTQLQDAVSSLEALDEKAPALPAC